MYLIFKRAIDLSVALFALIILTPFLLPIIIGLRFTGEGHVFYRQERVGLKNKKFLIWKFATMLQDSPNMDGGILTTKNDPRITPMGTFLRKSKINELPQLLNILVGNMSIVGPRPVVEISFKSYPEEVQKIIYNVSPGLTGIGSIIFRDEEELITEVKNRGEDVFSFYKKYIYPFKGELEIFYQENKSFSLDMKIIFATAWVIFFPQSQIYKRIFKGLPQRKV